MQGIISSKQRDSFNLPDDLREAMEKCISFEIERLQVFEAMPSMGKEDFEEYIEDTKMFGCMKSILVNIFVETLVEAHIGKECT